MLCLSIRFHCMKYNFRGMLNDRSIAILKDTKVSTPEPVEYMVVVLLGLSGFLAQRRKSFKQSIA